MALYFILQSPFFNSFQTQHTVCNMQLVSDFSHIFVSLPVIHVGCEVCLSRILLLSLALMYQQSFITKVGSHLLVLTDTDAEVCVIFPSLLLQIALSTLIHNLCESHPPSYLSTAGVICPSWRLGCFHPSAHLICHAYCPPLPAGVSDNHRGEEGSRDTARSSILCDLFQKRQGTQLCKGVTQTVQQQNRRTFKKKTI